MGSPKSRRAFKPLSGLLSRIRTEHVLFFILLALQGPLWFGEGGWRDVWSLEEKVESQSDEVERLEAEINALEAEVEDLQTGSLVVEERARSGLGLIQPEEEFVQFSGSGPTAAPANPGPATDRDPPRPPPAPRPDP